MLSISEQLQYSTIRLESEHRDGSISTGTGYIFKFKENSLSDDHIPVIITNKHVIKNSTKGLLNFTTIDNNHQPVDTDHFKVSIGNFENQWRMHPDEDVDLCAMPIGEVLNELKDRGITLFYIPLDKSLIPSKEQLAELTALEDIIMIGYPNGIWDKVNNKPIFRKGITATHPNYDYEGKEEFMIDAACFPGSSGSPVFLFNGQGYSDKRGNTYMGVSRLYLLGTLYAGPQHTTTGEVKIVNIPTSQKPIAISSIPNNLGLIIKSSRILELEKLF